MAFKREPRYLVMKLKDIHDSLTDVERDLLRSLQTKVTQHRNSLNKGALKCLVVESDWPEFEPTWKAIQYRSSES